MEQNKPAQMEIKVTWGFAWALWWRSMLFSLAVGAIIYIPLMILLAAIGLMSF